MIRKLCAACVSTALLTTGLAACSTGRTQASAGGKLRIVAAENMWGDIARNVGGDLVEVRSIINSPSADPHDYEPTAADAIAVGSADLVVVNGLGYDSWAQKLANANKVKGVHLLDVGEADGRKSGDNPHVWYGGPASINRVIDALVSRLTALAPAHAGDFARSAAAYRRGALASYSARFDEIDAKWSGTKVGGSESLITPLARALGLDLITPEPLLDAISEGAEPTVQDKKTTDRQIADRDIKVFVFNSQNATPDVQSQVRLAQSRGIPVVTVTETPSPQGTSFVDWQVAQLDRFAAALTEAS